MILNSSQQWVVVRKFCGFCDTEISFNHYFLIHSSLVTPNSALAMDQKVYFIGSLCCSAIQGNRLCLGIRVLRGRLEIILNFERHCSWTSLHYIFNTFTWDSLGYMKCDLKLGCTSYPLESSKEKMFPMQWGQVRL